MADLAKMTPSELRETVVRERKAKLARYAKDRAQRLPKATVSSILTAAGGLAAGALDAKYPSIQGTPVGGGLVLGAGGLIAGFALGGSEGDAILEAGQGAIAGALAVKTYKHFGGK